MHQFAARDSLQSSSTSVPSRSLTLGFCNFWYTPLELPLRSETDLALISTLKNPLTQIFSPEENFWAILWGTPQCLQSSDRFASYIARYTQSLNLRSESIALKTFGGNLCSFKGLPYLLTGAEIQGPKVTKKSLFSPLPRSLHKTS